MLISSTSTVFLNTIPALIQIIFICTFKQVANNITTTGRAKKIWYFLMYPLTQLLNLLASLVPLCMLPTNIVILFLFLSKRVLMSLTPQFVILIILQVK